MATTLTGDVFIPEIATEVATAQFPSELALGFAGSPFVRALGSDVALGVEGDLIKFPRWEPLGEFTDLTEDTAMTPEKLTSAMDYAPLIVGGKAAEITDWASLAARGDPSAEIGRQIAALAARYADQKIIDVAELTELAHDGTAGIIGWDVFVDAITTHWGDRAYDMVGGIVVHSKQMGDLMKDADFMASNTLGAPGTIQTGWIGQLGRYPVYVSDRLTVDSGPQYNALILKAGAMGLKFQRTLLVETDRDILSKNDVIAADVRFAVHQLYGVPRTVIKLQTD